MAFCDTIIGQIDPSKIDIVRDQYGVPHIFAPTDPEVCLLYTSPSPRDS